MLVPVLETVPGSGYDDLKNAVQITRSYDALVMYAIGTNQESTDEDVIKRIAIDNKIVA